MKRTRSPLHQPGAESVHSDRPWVYFMIDCFFLVTQFFVITFHIKIDDLSLPRGLPPGEGARPSNPPPIVDEFNRVRIHVAQAGGAPVYECMQQPCSLSELEAALARLKSAGRECSVRLSYDPAVPYGAVLAVFNACNRLNIRQCGLIPTHDVEL
ncbi:MAG: biopolymer transporter ExbD [Planctomycetota bacterium]